MKKIDFQLILDRLKSLFRLLIIGNEQEITLSCTTFPKQILFFTCLQYKSFENTAGKGETARNEQFLLFPQCFLPFMRIFSHFHQIWNIVCKLFQFGRFWNVSFVKGLYRVFEISSANFFSLEDSEMCRLWKGYTVFLNDNVKENENIVWKEEMLLKSFYSHFSHCLFYPFDDKPY